MEEMRADVSANEGGEEGEGGGQDCKSGSELVSPNASSVGAPTSTTLILVCMCMCMCMCVCVCVCVCLRPCVFVRVLVKIQSERLLGRILMEQREREIQQPLPETGRGC
jgi:hypothetical protein